MVTKGFSEFHAATAAGGSAEAVSMFAAAVNRTFTGRERIQVRYHGNTYGLVISEAITRVLEEEK